jgi:hypothetical protein
VAIESSWWRDSDSFRDEWLAAARGGAGLAPAMVMPVTELIVFLPDEIA